MSYQSMTHEWEKKINFKKINVFQSLRQTVKVMKQKPQTGRKYL